MKNNYTGVFSWKFPLKTGLSKEMVYHLIKDEEVDVISFCTQEFRTKSGISYKYLEFTELVHPGFLEGFAKLCEHLKFKVEEPKCVIYSNFWLAKEEVYNDYVNNVLIPAIDFLHTPEMEPYTWKDSTYDQRGGLKKEDLKKYTGLDYYPMACFLLERLPSIWVDNTNKTFKILNKLTV